MMSKKYKLLGLSFVMIFCMFAFSFFVSNNFKTSYAINTGVDSSGFPTSTFSTNVTSSTTSNYIRNALTANNNSSSFSNNFDVVRNLRTSDNATPLYMLMKNLEVPMSTESFEIITGNPSNITDKGLLYILAHGYNTTNTNYNIFSTNQYGAVTDNNIKQYITQMAIWLYIYENKTNFSSTYCSNGGCDFTENNSATLKSSSDIRTLINNCGRLSGYNYLNYITLLVDNAKNYSGSENSSLTSLAGTLVSYQINDDFTLLVTDTITPSVSSNRTNFMYYSIEIKDPNNYGVYLTDINNNKITNLNVFSGSFKVTVPLAEDITTMDLSSIEIQVYGHFVKDTGYDYRVTDTNSSLLNSNKTQKYSNVMFGYTPSEIVKTSFRLYNFTKISKVDITTKKELPGATLVLTNKNDETKTWTWVSTVKPHYLALENGEYELCETIAPEGYEKKEECIGFNVNGNSIKGVVMENEPIVPVPNTSLFSSKSIYIIGAVLLIIGGLTTSMVLFRKNN